jgi:hypothetical protein
MDEAVASASENLDEMRAIFQDVVLKGIVKKADDGSIMKFLLLDGYRFEVFIGKTGLFEGAFINGQPINLLS